MHNGFYVNAAAMEEASRKQHQVNNNVNQQQQMLHAGQK